MGDKSTFVLALAMSLCMVIVFMSFMGTVPAVFGMISTFIFVWLSTLLCVYTVISITKSLNNQPKH